RVRAASGPYAAELRASSPKTGIPARGPICSARSSLVASGRPNSRFNNRVVTPMNPRESILTGAALDAMQGKPPMALSHGDVLTAEGERLARAYPAAVAAEHWESRPPRPARLSVRPSRPSLNTSPA